MSQEVKTTNLSMPLHLASADCRAEDVRVVSIVYPVGVDTGLPWMELTLPQPPSVNRFMAKLGNKSPVVKAWIKQADMAYVLQRADLALCGRSMTKIFGRFEIRVIFERDKSDFHNRLKPLFDWLQRVELIQNDRYCERLVGLWGERGSGCLVKLRPYVGS